MKTSAHYDVLGSVDGMAVLVLLLLLIRSPDRKFRALAVLRRVGIPGSPRTDDFRSAPNSHPERPLQPPVLDG